MRVLYLHGLESMAGGPKVSYLTSKFDVVAPVMDYMDKDCLQNVIFHEGFSDTEQPFDLIIGSSMGGYLGSILSNTYKVPAILFNPALHSRRFELDLPFKKFFLGEVIKEPNKVVVLGKNDKVINFNKTLEIIGDNPCIDKVLIDDMKHRIPIDIFIDVIEQYTPQLVK